MLISRRNGTLNLVTQPDHGRLAGVLAEHWGNDEFAHAALREPLLYIAAYHDDGWQGLDGEPRFNEEKQRPAHFLEVPLPVSSAEIKKCVDRIYEASPVAGALESMHFTGFYTSRWGVDDGPHVGHPDVPAIVEFEEDRRTRAIRESWPHERPRSDFEREIWHAYEILQVLDLLSLCICLVDLGRESEQNEQVMARTLMSIDQEPSRRIILRAPKSQEGERVDLTITVAAPNVVEVDPFPFAGTEFTMEVPSRVMEDKSYASAEDAAEAYHSAPVQMLQCSVVGARAGRS